MRQTLAIALCLVTTLCSAQNGLVDIWSSLTRPWGVCYGPGYHQPQNDQHPTAKQVYVKHGHYMPSHVAPANQPQPMIAPQYMTPSHTDVPSQYNAPIPKPQRQPRQLVGPDRIAPPKRQEPYEPASPSDQSPASRKPILSVPSLEIDAPERHNREESPFPASPQKQGPASVEPIAPPVEAPVTESSPYRDVPELPAANAQESDPQADTSVDDDLLIPPDTGLLDGVSYPRSVPRFTLPATSAYRRPSQSRRSTPQYRTARAPRNFVVEP